MINKTDSETSLKTKQASKAIIGACNSIIDVFTLSFVLILKYLYVNQKNCSIGL